MIDDPVADQRHPAMPPWVPRAIGLFFAGVVALWAMSWLFVQLRSLLIMLGVSLMISFALEPAVNRLERMGMRRSVGTLLVFTLTVVAAVSFGWVVGRVVANQSAELIDRGPTYIAEAETWINKTFDAEVDTAKLLVEFQAGGRLSDVAAAIAPNILAVGSRVVVVLFQFLTVAMFSYYLVADGPRLRRLICSLLPPDRQRSVLRAWEVAVDKTGGYLYSRAVLALASFLFHWATFAMIGIPSPVALALWVAIISQFIPVIGTYLAGLLPALVALAEQPVSALWVLGLIILYQQLENYLLAPRITAQTMEVHAAVAFGAVIAGAAVLGPIGAVLALPVTATCTSLASSLFQRHDVVDSHLTDRDATRRRWFRSSAPDERVIIGARAAEEPSSGVGTVRPLAEPATPDPAPSPAADPGLDPAITPNPTQENP